MIGGSRVIRGEKDRDTLSTKLEQEIGIRTPMLEQHWYTFMFPKLNLQYTIKRDRVLRFNMLLLKHQMQYCESNLLYVIYHNLLNPCKFHNRLSLPKIVLSCSEIVSLFPQSSNVMVRS